MTEDDAFAFLKADNGGDCISYSGFCEALRQVCRCRYVFHRIMSLTIVHGNLITCIVWVFLQLKLIGHCSGLSDDELRELWEQTDIDKNGIVNYKEFKVSLSLSLSIKF